MSKCAYVCTCAYAPARVCVCVCMSVRLSSANRGKTKFKTDKKIENIPNHNFKFDQTLEIDG